MNDLIDNYLKENEYYSISYESSEFVNEELASPQIKNAIDYIKKKLDFSYSFGTLYGSIMDMLFQGSVHWRCEQSGAC